MYQPTGRCCKMVANCKLHEQCPATMSEATGRNTLGTHSKVLKFLLKLLTRQACHSLQVVRAALTVPSHVRHMLCPVRGWYRWYS